MEWSGVAGWEGESYASLGVLGVVSREYQTCEWRVSGESVYLAATENV